MGLFDKFKKNQQPKTDSEAIEREMYENNTLGYGDLKDHTKMYTLPMRTPAKPETRKRSHMHFLKEKPQSFS